MPDDQIPQKFLVSFSFAGEQRPLVRSVAEAVRRRLGPDTVFFDEWFEFYIAGADADTRLQEIYSQRSEVVVVCVSGNYGGKEWTLAEHEAIRGLQMQLRTSKNQDDVFRILPLRVGDGDVKGIPFNTIVPDIRKRSLEHTTDLIISRLRLLNPAAGRANDKPAVEPEQFVYLAETTPDLDDPGKPINRHRVKSLVEGLGLTVLPREDYPDAQFLALAETDIGRSLAFVQLRGPYAWKRGGFDQAQNDIAMKLGTRRFVYRNSDIVLASVEPEWHRNFLAAPEVIFTGFDDFLVYLERELKLVIQSRQSATTQPAATDPPLVRVTTHSANPDTLWAQVFEWIFIEQGIAHDYLGPHESFEEKHQIEPCQGFLVVCDSAALEDGPMSPRGDMEQCRKIQIREKDASRRPAVAMVYWPPPKPAWDKLLRSVPLNLTYAEADLLVRAAPAKLGKFFEDVRRVAR